MSCKGTLWVMARLKIMVFILRIRNKLSFIDATRDSLNPKTALIISMAESALQHTSWSRDRLSSFSWCTFQLMNHGKATIWLSNVCAAMFRYFVVNKIDKRHPDQLLAQIDDSRSHGTYEIAPISQRFKEIMFHIWLISEWKLEGDSTFGRPNCQITQNVIWDSQCYT